jgi:septum formation protein
MIKSYSGNTHQVISSVALLCDEIQFSLAKISKTDVTFRELSDWEIESYLSTDDYQDKAGAYGIQNGAKLFVQKISGSYTNIVGFPTEVVIELLKEYNGV